MGIIRKLTPLNLQEEKDKFFKDFSYNPQFKYSHKFQKKDLTSWGYPKQNFVNHAKRMIDLHGPYLNSSTKNISKEDIEKKCSQLFTKLKIESIPILFSKKYISRVMIDKKGLYFRLPIRYNATQIKNTLNHEIQTHLLRRINDSKQSWSGRIKKEPSFRETEEGLATLHSYIDTKNKILKKTFTGYYTTHLAQQYSFSQIFAKLIKLGLSPELAWSFTVRRKRGLTDTGNKGGCTKDIIYFEGAVKIWKWLQNKNNDPKDLYIGRLSLKNIERKRGEANKKELIYPTFFENISEYRSKINKIASKNQFAEI